MNKFTLLVALAASLSACADFNQAMAEVGNRPPGGRMYMPAVDPTIGPGKYDVDVTECNLIAARGQDFDYGINARIGRHQVAVSRCMAGRGYSVLD